MALAPIFAAAALVLSATSAPASSAPTPEVRARVHALLGSIHGPVPAESFRAIGPGVEEALVDFARGNDFPSRRIRALQALEGLGGARAQAAHRDVAADQASPSAVRRAAIRGLARLVPPADAARELGPFLDSDGDPAVRATAAEALAARSPGDGCARVRDRALREPDPSRFGRALETCDRAVSRAPAGG
jgi:HEAT repeat protein